MSTGGANDTYFGIDLGTTNTVISRGNVLFNGLIQSQIIQIMQVDEHKCPTMEFILPSPAGRAVWVLARAGARLACPVTPRPREGSLRGGPCGPGAVSQK